MQNKMTIYFLSISENEAFARNVVASFMISLNPTLSELNDVKTAVSEAVTNAIVHGYPDSVGVIELEGEINDFELHIKIKDYGVGIENIDLAVQSHYSSKEELERSGMGFTIMKTFMDEFSVESSVNKGTLVKMCKRIQKNLAV